MFSKCQKLLRKIIRKKQQAAYAPIDKKFMEATEKAAKANGWDFIFDSNTMGLIYKGGADATAAVKKIRTLIKLKISIKPLF
ncbi:OmpH family outer membrane protein [Riemerella anatipestifer]|nr:OmpH family outer membrane protein [Riemerella anatipestifer]